jgi:Ca2+-binding EF-hand superfamily protein
MAERMGITNGVMTRHQYQEYTKQREAERGGAPGGPAAAGAPGGAGGQDGMNNWAESMFRRMDRNGDGLLNNDEMPEALRIERDKWDTNKDGFIDLAEFKAYFQARLQQVQAERNGAGGLLGNIIEAPPVEEEEQKPVVYRAGKLPKELPAWFAQLDTDGDGQIGLYEWKNSGRSLREFQEMDRNGDGFLTIDEVMRTVTVVKGNGESSPGNGFGMANGFAGGMQGAADGRMSYMAGPQTWGRDGASAWRGGGFQPGMGGGFQPGMGGGFQMGRGGRGMGGPPGMGGPNGGGRGKGGRGGDRGDGSSRKGRTPPSSDGR